MIVLEVDYPKHGASFDQIPLQGYAKPESLDGDRCRLVDLSSQELTIVSLVRRNTSLPSEAIPTLA